MSDELTEAELAELERLEKAASAPMNKAIQIDQMMDAHELYVAARNALPKLLAALRRERARPHSPSRDKSVRFEFETLHRIWHVGCPKNAVRSGVCREIEDYRTLPDGSSLKLFECMSCGERAYTGVDKSRRIVIQPTAPAAPEGLAWIPASERLPESSRMVAVCYQPDPKPLTSCKAAFYGKDGRWTDWNCFELHGVFAWLPLPAKPAAPAQEVPRG